MNARTPQDLALAQDAQAELRQMLVDSARRWAETANTAGQRAQSVAHAHGCPPERWRELAELGWLGMRLPEEDGGLGAGLPEVCLLAEQLGRQLLVEPFVACGMLGAGVLADSLQGDDRSEWLAALAAGERRVAWLVWEADGDAQLALPAAEAVQDGAGWRVSGAKGAMPGASGADAYLVTARLAGSPGQLGLFLMDAGASGVTAESLSFYDGRHAARVQLADAPARLLLQGPVDAVIARLQAQLDQGLIAHCAETLGAAQAALDITLDYLRTRRQFGRAISDNQVIQHRLVDLYVEQQEARALCLAAAEWPEPATVAALGLRTADVARHAWEEAIQLHGAIGMTEGYAVGEYVRRLALAAQLYGTPAHHAERLAALSLGALR